MINVARFRIVNDNMSKTLKNVVFMLQTIIHVTNDVEYGVEVKRKPLVFSDEPLLPCSNHDSSFIDLCNSFNDDKMLLIFPTFQHLHF